MRIGHSCDRGSSFLALHVLKLGFHSNNKTNQKEKGTGRRVGAVGHCLREGVLSLISVNTSAGAETQAFDLIGAW